jgi:hypothetical protein
VNHQAATHVATFLLGWTLLGLVSVVIWSLTFGKWMNVEKERGEKGARCLEIADAYRELRATTGLDGEAYTYEQAAKHWEEKAREHGVERLPRHSSHAPNPHTSQASRVAVQPWRE